MIEYNIKINMQGEREICEDIVFTSGDKNGYRLNLAFYSNGKLYDTSNCALTVKTKRADETVVIDSGVCTADGVHYDVADNAIAVEGEVKFEIALVRANGEYVTTAVVLARVRKGFGEAGLLSSDNEPVLAKLEAQSLVTQAKANAVAGDLAEHIADTAAHDKLFNKEHDLHANALKGEVGGTEVILDDVSPVEHKVDVNISSKNLIPFPYFKMQQGNQMVQSGLTVTFNDDGSVTLDGTPTETVILELYLASKTQTILKKGKTYTISLKNSPNNWHCFLGNNISSDGNGWNGVLGTTEGLNNPRSVMINEDYKGFQLYIVIAKNIGTVENLTVYPQLEEGTSATEYTPYVPNVADSVIKVQDENGVLVSEYASDADGNAEITSFSPTMVFTTDTEGINIKAKYNKDTNKVIEKLTNAIIAMGGNV